MNFDPVDPPRRFSVGFGSTVTLADCGRLRLDPDEQVTCITEAGVEYDVLRKSWGFYATPSLNGRLTRDGLRGLLALNQLGDLFLLLVDHGQEASFARYMADEGLRVVQWLDTDAEIGRLLAALDDAGAALTRPDNCCPICSAVAADVALTYDAPPPGETRFDWRGAEYRREYRRCRNCGHFRSVHSMDLSALYEGAYADATYGSADGMRHSFERIVALPPERSDNTHRVQRIVAFASRVGIGSHLEKEPALLDIGAGLGVFPWGMTGRGWSCVALDPDPRAAQHIRNVVGCAAVVGNFMALDLTALGTFDAITLNKVLEHVVDPLGMLARTHPLLNANGFIYIEVPDTAAATAPVSQNREEFFIEHHHVFSPVSLAILVERAGFALVSLERLREPSGKYTLCAFVRRADPDRGFGHEPSKGAE
ncbi:class I SAM-dependent methyltransferase (plasmid) [Azospirillum sp. A29]|uniref:class I SAM-dependent methyltransferase n=1 Tax=Azospirillum sp. A29 TaxID=3160606 RepID=UPI00366A6D37